MDNHRLPWGIKVQLLENEESIFIQYQIYYKHSLPDCADLQKAADKPYSYRKQHTDLCRMDCCMRISVEAEAETGRWRCLCAGRWKRRFSWDWSVTYLHSLSLRRLRAGVHEVSCCWAAASSSAEPPPRASGTVAQRRSGSTATGTQELDSEWRSMLVSAVWSSSYNLQLSHLACACAGSPVQQCEVLHAKCGSCSSHQYLMLHTIWFSPDAVRWMF